MADVTVRQYTPAHAQAILDLQVRYAAAYPGAQVVPPDVYAGPGFAHCRNVWCAYAAAGRLVGYTALYRGGDGGPAQPVLWGVVKPDAEAPDPLEVRRALLARLLSLVEQTRATAGVAERLCFEHLPSEGPAVEFALANGFTHAASAFDMRRDLHRPIAPATLPPGIDVLWWKMESEVEQRRYLAARNASLPEPGWTLDSLRFLLGSPLWRDGVAITAFAGEEMAGSVLAYWDPEENARTGRLSGYTEEVFVLPQWRGRGIGRHLLARALEHLRHHGLEEGRLSVSTSNRGALDLYQSLGYEVLGEMLHLCREV